MTPLIIEDAFPIPVDERALARLVAPRRGEITIDLKYVQEALAKLGLGIFRCAPLDNQAEGSGATGMPNMQGVLKA